MYYSLLLLKKKSIFYDIISHIYKFIIVMQNYSYILILSSPSPEQSKL